MSAEATAVAGIVLAAGRSVRMGRPKALLESDGRTLLEHAAAALRAGGCTDVCIVVAANAPAVRSRAAGAGSVVVAPDRPDAQPIDSLRCALAALPEAADVAVVLPVDCPFVRAETVRAILARMRGDVDAAVPTWRRTDGHPVVLHRRLFVRIQRETPVEGLRSLLSDPAVRVARIAVDDPGVTLDLDTPADARRSGVRV